METESWRQKTERETDDLASEFVARHPEYQIDQDQPEKRGLANCIVVGRRNDERVVFKWFCDDERKARESFAMRYWESTGLVPRLIDEDDNFVIMSFLPGTLLQEIIESVDIDLVGQQIGHSLARLTGVRLSDAVAEDFARHPYSGTSLEQYFERILTPARSICETSLHYREPGFRTSIDLIEAHAPFIMDQPRVIYNQDIRNVMFEGNEFRGFFDLESSWIGTEVMQIGSLWWLLRVAERNAGSGANLWKAFVRSYEEARDRSLTGQEMDSARAVARLLVWRDASSYGNWFGDNDKAPEDETEASPRYAEELDMITDVMCDVDS